MSIKTVQSYSVQANGLRDYIPETIFTPAGDTWKRNPAWLPMTGFNYSFDSTFGLGTGFNDTVTVIKIQSDGKILVGGYFTTYQGTTYNRIIRLNSDGSIDTSFNIGTGFSSSVQSIIIQPDGKILCGGSFSTYNGTTRNLITRLNSDGTLDTSFDPGTGFGGTGPTVYDMALQSDGKILCVGVFTSFNGTSCGYIARLNSNGTLDTSFNAGGTGFNGYTLSVKISANGKILVGGPGFGSYNGKSGPIDGTWSIGQGIVLLTADGLPDPDFNVGGGLFASRDVYAVEFQPDGKILIGGNFAGYSYGGYNGRPSVPVSWFFRINSDGSYDDTFTVNNEGFNSFVNSIQVQSDGKILVGGYFTTYKKVSRKNLARLNSDGSYDATFDLGTGFSFLLTSSFRHGLAVQPDGKILVGGEFTSYQGTTRNRLVRLNTTEEKISILKAVFPNSANSDFISFWCSGNYTVNWGDGNTVNYNSTVIAQYQYDYANTNLDNTNGPVTFTDAGDLVTRTYHGYANNDIITFSSITNTTGINISTPYYVANSQANTFQLSASNGGSILTLTTDGTGTLLSYKQALITITPQAGANLTRVVFHSRHSLVPNNQYESGFLDMAISIPNLSSASNFGIGSTSMNDVSTYVNFNMLEQVNILNYGSLTSCSLLFYYLRSLKSVSLFNTANVTSMFQMFNNCVSLKSVPLFNTANVTNMYAMFNNCNSLRSVPLFNTANVTDINAIFANCYNLKSVPLLDTSKVTSMYSMFNGCYSLESVPLFNTSNVINLYNMFYRCYSLKSVPLFDTSKSTNMNYMFYNCVSLKSVPLFNTANVTSMSSMFFQCNELKSVPLFNTSKVTNMSSMFYNCYSLESVPLFNTANVTNMNYMFNGCYSLESVPLFNTSNVTYMEYLFGSCYNLKSVPLFDTSKVTSMYAMFYQCYNLQSVPLFNTANVTTMNYTFQSAYNLKSVPFFDTSKVTSMSSMFASCNSLQSVPLFNTANVTTMYGMFENCTSLKTVPLFDTSKLTNMDLVFNGCYNLESVPLFNTANVTSMYITFFNCFSLETIPKFNTANVTNMYWMLPMNTSNFKKMPQLDTSKVINMTGLFASKPGLKEIPALNCASVSSSTGFSGLIDSPTRITRSQLYNTKYSISYANQNLSGDSLNEIYTNLPTVVGQTITVTGNWGTATDDPTIATAKGWTVTG